MRFFFFFMMQIQTSTCLLLEHPGCIVCAMPLSVTVASRLSSVTEGELRTDHPPPLSWVNFLWDMMGDSVVCGSLCLVFLFSQCTHPYWPVGEEVERFQLRRRYWYFALVSWGQKGMCNHNMTLCKVRRICESLWSLYGGVTTVSEL